VACDREESSRRAKERGRLRCQLMVDENGLF
jgi:hypothetical protein